MNISHYDAIALESLSCVILKKIIALIFLTILENKIEVISKGISTGICIMFTTCIEQKVTENNMHLSI